MERVFYRFFSQACQREKNRCTAPFQKRLIRLNKELNFAARAQENRLRHLYQPLRPSYIPLGRTSLLWVFSEGRRTISGRTEMATWCTLCLLVVPLGHSTLLVAIQASSAFHQNKIALRCSGGSENVKLFHKIGDSSLALVSMSVSRVTLILDHRTEGVYYCQDERMKSNEMLFVAHPYPDPDPTRSYSANIGDDLTMNCTIPRGILIDRYSVRWFKGPNEIVTDSSSHFSLDGFALVFSGVEASDYGNGYYCKVSVRVDDDSIITRQGSTIALNIMAPLQLISGLTNASALVGEELRLTCHAKGVPAPKFRWLVNGQQQEAHVTNIQVSRADSSSIKSEYVISEVMESDTGPVTCMALHERNGTIFTASSTVNLIVLTNMFNISVILNGGKLLLRGKLPVHITGSFTLRVRFNSSDKIIDNSTAIDLTLGDTDEINSFITRDEIPKHLVDFTVAVAIKNYGQVGPFTSPSNRIVFPNVDSCPCPIATAVAVISFASLLVITIVGYGLVWHMKRTRKGHHIRDTSKTEPSILSTSSKSHCDSTFSSNGRCSDGNEDEESKDQGFKAIKIEPWRMIKKLGTMTETLMSGNITPRKETKTPRTATKTPRPVHKKRIGTKTPHTLGAEKPWTESNDKISPSCSETSQSSSTVTH